MLLSSVYLVVNDFERSIAFYEKLLEISVSIRNMDRFASFHFNGKCISLMNGHFDADHPDKVVRKGAYVEPIDQFRKIALAPNTNKFVLNFWSENLCAEYIRLKGLNISLNMSGILYVYNVSPYYFFTLTDPDGNAIEVTGNYTPSADEFDE